MLLLGLSIFSTLEILSQEFHRAAHSPPAKTAKFLNFLIDNGIAISRKQHFGHHTSPYEDNYCIVSGVCNEWMDSNDAFRWMEKRVFDLTGEEPNSWKVSTKFLKGDCDGDGVNII